MGKRGKALKRKRAGLSPLSSKDTGSFLAANAEEDDSEDDGSNGSEAEPDRKKPQSELDEMLGGLSQSDVDTAIRVVSHLGEHLELFRY